MSNPGDFFHTDWAAMTLSDWIGTLLTVVVFLLMCGLYFYVWRPKNKQRLESHRYMALDEDDLNSGDRR